MAEGLTMPSTSSRRDCSIQCDMSVLKAIEDKYLENNTDNYNKNPEIEILHNLTAITGSGKVVLPQCLALNYCHIKKAGDCRRLHELCRHVKELDIAENDLADWNEVLSVVNQVPYLQFLNLSSNPLTEKLTKPNASAHLTLTGLALNNTKVPWDTVYGLLHIMPSVEELHLSLNDYRKIPSPLENRTYPQLKLLQFNENHISTWEELTPLGSAFPQLTSLILIGNKLSGKVTPEVGAHFPKLSCLNITNTCIASWEELESLNSFPSLTDVRLQNIPFCEDLQEKQRRQLSISRLGKVTRLNGSPVLDLEREDAERAFLRYYMDSATKPARFLELQDKYGHLDELVNINLCPPHHVRCTVRMESGDRSKVFNVNVKQTCKEFKRMLSDFAGVPSKKFNLFYIDMEIESVKEEIGKGVKLMYPNKQLYTYQLNHGDEFVVYKKWEPGDDE